MGKIRARRIKRYAKQLMEMFPNRVSTNFEENKRLVDEFLKPDYETVLSLASKIKEEAESVEGVEKVRVYVRDYIMADSINKEINEEEEGIEEV